ncbi:hypothetical protein HX096_15615 [Empedobacter falsenii]|uniref:hypothetical protein n=1 Tax=Empedobacter falsenii TaxID=343874 RepID=UPI0025752CA0|nr:hypothetical protein [Empedobacter falsenii]MDM1549282.1 hypothetical protein [Empedobacter falsenii]
MTYNTAIVFFLLSSKLFAQTVNQRVVGVITDGKGYQISTATNRLTIPYSQNLLAFRIGNTYFTTGVNDDIVKTNNTSWQECGGGNNGTAAIPCISYQNFKAFPAKDLGNLKRHDDSTAGRTKNLIGLPKDSKAEDFPNNYRYYLDDGEKGLDIITAMFNITLDVDLITFNKVNVNSSSINDGIPDIIITQNGALTTAAANYDYYSFRNQNGTVVGVDYPINFANVLPTIRGKYNFYNYDYNLKDNEAINKSRINDAVTSSCTPDGCNGERDIRILALDWSDLGITQANYQNIHSFNQKFNGASDIAFIAFNEESLLFQRNISGNVLQVALDGVTKTPFPTAYIEMELYLVKNGIIETTPIATTTLDSSGNYTFVDALSNLPNETYRVVAKITTAAAETYHVVENVDNTLNNYVDLKLELDNIDKRDFVIGNFCLKEPNITQRIGKSTPMAISTINKQAEGWPNIIPNAHLVLESKEKGLVITRTTENSIKKADLAEGMIIYDTEEKCIKLYDGTKWFCIQRDCNEE